MGFRNAAARLCADGVKRGGMRV